MRPIHLFLSLLFISGQLLASHNPFTVIPPKSWDCINDPTQLPKKVKLLYVGKGKAAFSPSFNVACEDTGLDIDLYISDAKNYHESQADTTVTVLGSLQTKSGMAHVLKIDRPTQWGKVCFIQAVVIQEQVAYVMTGTCLQENFGLLSPQFFKTIQSFTLKEPLKNTPYRD